MKIAVVNVHSARNAGDAILLEMTLHLLKQAYPHAKITLVMNDVTSVSQQHRAVGSFATWLKNFDESSDEWRPMSLLFAPYLMLMVITTIAWYRLFKRVPLLPLQKTHRTLLQTYTEADLIVSVAGNFLYSSGRLGLPFALAILGMGFGTWLNKPVVMFPQTLGPIRGQRDAQLLRWLLKRLKLIFLRDAHSLDVMQECEIPTTNCHVVPDIAFGFPSAENNAGAKLLAVYGVDYTDNQPKMGVTAINWGGLNNQFKSQQQYEVSMAQAIRYFIEQKQGQVILFSQVQGPTEVEDDRLTAARIYKMLPDLHHSLVYIDQRTEPHVLKSAYRLMDIFVGTRLHSNIFALSEAVPVVAIAYQPKTHGTMKILSLEHWAIDIESLSEKKLIEKIEALWQQRAALKTQLQVTLLTVRQQIDAISKQLPQIS